MSAVRSLLSDGTQLKAKYGLKIERPLGLLQGTERPASIPSAFERVFQGTARFWNTSLQRKEHIKGMILWTISDKERFENLVDHLRNLITDLGQLTGPYGVAQSQIWIVKYEMEKIEDESSLEAITEVNSSAPDDDLVSVAASRQLALVRERSVVVGQTNDNSWGGLIQPDDSISLLNQPKMPQIQELEEDINIGPQPLEITRVLPSQWRNVKTRQGLFPWLGVLIVCTNTATARPLVAVRDAKAPGHNDPLDYIRRAMSFDDEDKDGRADLREAAESVVSPSRVAINSRTLLAMLAKVTKIRISESNNVMVHPFKYLVLHAEKIRKVYQSVCDECETHGFQQSTDITTTAVADSNDSESSAEDNTNTAVEARSDEDLLRDIYRVKAELQCLIEFMDTDLAAHFKFLKDIEQRHGKVGFEHLWHYFNPNDVVFRTLATGTIDCERSQGYVIIHVSGGRPILDVTSHDDGNTASKTLSQLARPGDICGDESANASTSIMTPFILDCLFLDYDGRVFGPRPQRIIIPPFPGLRAAGRLPVGFGSLEQREAMKKRGSIFVDAVKPRFEGIGHFTFSGTSNSELEAGHSETCRHCSQTNIVDEVDGAIIVDPAAAIQYLKSQSCTLDVQFGAGVVARPTQHEFKEVFEPLNRDHPTGPRYTDVFDDSVIDRKLRESAGGWIRLRLTAKRLMQDDEWLEGARQILPPHVLAFSLGNRKWYSLPVSKLCRISTDDRGSIWDDLVLPQGHKPLVLALVSALGGPENELPPNTSNAHKTQYESVSAISRSRRRCLTVLMHGAPGTGKTHLVEGVADRLRRPLFVINCAELGTVERGAIAKLEHWFGLAKKWHCVLLLKEVDAFLARRTRGDEVERVEITSGMIRISYRRITLGTVC